MAFTIREMRDGDRTGVAALDTSFETRTRFDIVVKPRALELVETPLEKPLVKRYPNADIFAHWSTWDTGFVAEDDAIIGFAGVEYVPWHLRLVLWHLYVAPSRRREGVARALLERCEAHGRTRGARLLWLETSTLNVPGVRAYERLGYSLCGADTTLYEGLPYANEQALYLMKRL